jgi:formyl-CoA transferase
LLQVLGPLPIAWDQLGYLQPRMGSRLPYSSPRNAYICKDGKWVALSASAEAIAGRVFDAIERPEFRDDPRFATHTDRVTNAADLDEAIQAWLSRHTRDEALEIFARHDAALAPIYEMSEFFDDPHVRARGSLETVADADWGDITMQGVHPRLSETPGRIASAGPSALGSHNAEVYAELGLSSEQIDELREGGVV